MEVRRKKDGEDGVFVFLPFMTKNIERNEASQVNYTPWKGHGVLVNVGWVPIAEYNKHQLRNFKLPDPENFEIVNSDSGRGDLTNRLLLRPVLQVGLHEGRRGERGRATRKGNRGRQRVTLWNCQGRRRRR